MSDTAQSPNQAAPITKLNPEAVAALNVKLNAIRRKAVQNQPQRPAIKWRGVQDETYLAALAWLDQHG